MCDNKQSELLKKGYLMSFLYARKIKDTILVLGDTKVTLDETQGKFLWKDTKTREDVKKYGIIKNVILANKICICFAGDISEANKFLNTAVKNQLKPHELVELAYQMHMQYNEAKIDFLLCFCNGEQQQIIEIKNKIKKDVDFAWIGSQQAFNSFQSELLGEQSKKNNDKSIVISYTVRDNSGYQDEADKIFNAYFHAIYHCNDNSVGGFPIKILFNKAKKSFVYIGYARKISSEHAGPLVNWLRSTARDGDFSLLQYTSTQVVGLYILHANVGLIYSNMRYEDDHSNESSNILYTAHSFKITQLDFYIQTQQYNIIPPGFLNCDPENYQEIYKRINHYKDYPKILILYIDKLIEIIERLKVHEEDLADMIQLQKETLEKIKHIENVIDN